MSNKWNGIHVFAFVAIMIRFFALIGKGTEWWSSFRSRCGRVEWSWKGVEILPEKNTSFVLNLFVLLINMLQTNTLELQSSSLFVVYMILFINISTLINKLNCV